MTEDIEKLNGLVKTMSDINMKVVSENRSAIPKLTEKQRTNREISNANLIPYVKGQSGNPGGKPEGHSITAELRKLIDKGTNAEDLALTLYELAKKGNRAQMEALKELLNRTDGKVPDTHKIESDVPINIVFKEVERKEDG